MRNRLQLFIIILRVFAMLWWKTLGIKPWGFSFIGTIKGLLKLNTRLQSNQVRNEQNNTS